MNRFKFCFALSILSCGLILLCSCSTLKETFSNLPASEPSQPAGPSHSFSEVTSSPVPTSTLHPEESALGIPVLCEEDYLQYISDAFESFATDNKLYAYRRDTRSPYFTYYFRPVIDNGDGTYKADSLTREEFETLFLDFKQFLLDTISASALEHGDGFFSRPRTQIIGFRLSNTFLDRTTRKTQELYVADFQVDLMDYYYQDYSDDYIKLETFDSRKWDIYDVIK